MIIRRVFLALVAVGFGISCSNDDDAAYARQVAADFKKNECLGADAPTEALRQHLVRLCTCSEERIAATPMSRTDSYEVQTEKIRVATDWCYEEWGGAPGEGRAGKAKSGKK